MRQFAFLIRGLASDRRGATAMEFALVALILVIALVASYDLGRAASDKTRMETAARAGAVYAQSFPTDKSGVITRVKALSPADATVEVNCACGGAVLTCSLMCPFGTARTTSIVVSEPFSSALITSLTKVSANVEVRIQ